MISAILYGRNDDHGYNLHKRVAISLNCIAELLDDDDDEIVFVDYNSANDLPTLPEAIGDTLTARARGKLRVLRVRPELHARFGGRTHLPVLEAVARNVALRRSNPANKWILSTNGDMIFVPQDRHSLSAIARDLPPGLYHTPRFELPEALWETFDRLDALGTIEAARHWGAAAHLNEIARADFVKYESPGDFQLMRRDDLCRIGGFDERLLRGWHLDYNIAKRLSFVYGEVGDLAEKIVGYHCDHTRRATPTHQSDHLSNSWHLAYDSVAQAEIAEQADSWGCPNDSIEEVRLEGTGANSYLRALRSVLPAPVANPTRVARHSRTHEGDRSNPHRVLPFIANILASAPRSWTAAWFGSDPVLFELFRKAWTALGFQGAILIPRELEASVPSEPRPPVKTARAADAIEAANVAIFDFGNTSGATAAASPEAYREGSDRSRAPLDNIESAFVNAVDIDRRRPAGHDSPARLFICVTALNNAYEQMVMSLLQAVRTPYSTGVRYGFARRSGELLRDWLSMMDIGPAGFRDQGTIRTRARRAGAAAYGPRIWLAAGAYRARVDVTLANFGGARGALRLLSQLGRIAYVHIAAGGSVLAKRSAFFLGPRKRSLTLEFFVPEAKHAAGASDFEAWIWTSGVYDLAISRLEVEALDKGVSATAPD